MKVAFIGLPGRRVAFTMDGLPGCLHDGRVAFIGLPGRRAALSNYWPVGLTALGAKCYWPVGQSLKGSVM